MDWILAVSGFYLIGLTGFLTTNGWHNVLIFRVPMLLIGALCAILGLSGLGFI